MNFDKFNSRVMIRGQIVTTTGLHIGAGGCSLDPSATDGPIIRDVAGRPFIPGSSFKGALRSHLESLARSVDRRPKLWSCEPLADPCIPSTKRKYDQLLTAEIRQRSCTVCQLFGSPWLASHVMTKDLFVNPEFWAGWIELRDGVGIDRDTETARHDIKYDFEAVPATTQFDLEIVVENAVGEDGDDLLGLLALGLHEMEQEHVALGGKTTRGLGRVKLELEEIEVIGDSSAARFDDVGSADLLDYLINGRGKLLKGKALHNYLQSKIHALTSTKLNTECSRDA